MRALTLIVRNLATSELADSNKQCPALDSFLARSVVATDLLQSTTGWICAAFGVKRQNDWPVGAILAQAREAPGVSAFWVCANPVHLAIDRDSLILQPLSELRISDQESQALVSAIRAHFATEQLEMIHIDTGVWVVGALHDQNLSTTELALAEGRSVDGLLPTGADAPWWQRMVTEAQMILHDHPVNIAREQRGEVPINSLWIWGGGTAPVIQKSFDTMHAADALLRALAALSGTPLMDLPGDALDIPLDHRYLVEFVVTDKPGTTGSISALETDWIAPAWRALGTGRLDELTLIVPLPNAIAVCQCDRKARRRFWRRNRTLTRLLGQWQARS